MCMQLPKIDVVISHPTEPTQGVLATDGGGDRLLLLAVLGQGLG